MKNTKKDFIISLIMVIGVFITPLSSSITQAIITEPEYKIYLVNTSDDTVVREFNKIVRNIVEVKTITLYNSKEFNLLTSKIPSSSVIVLVGHGSERGLHISDDLLSWDMVARTLNLISPYKVLVASCDGYKLKEYYQGRIISLRHTPDAKIMALWISYHLLKTKYELMALTGKTTTPSKDFRLEKQQTIDLIDQKVSQRNREIMADTNKFLKLGIYEDIYNRLDISLKSDSAGYPIDYWVYDNTNFEGYNTDGDKVPFGTEDNEGNNALNVIFYDFTLEEVRSILWECLGWYHLLEVGDKNYLNEINGAKIQDDDIGKGFWDDYPFGSTFYNQHMRVWEFPWIPDQHKLVVGQCHKSKVLFGHQWGLYEETEDLLISALDGYYYNDEFYIYGSETYPQTWRHVGSTNHPSDSDYPLDFQDGFCVIFSKNPIQIDNDVDNDGLSNTEELYGTKQTPTYAWDEDSDNDNLNDYEEWLYDTDPWVIDTDNDGFTDGEEIHTYNTDPTDDNDYPIDFSSSWSSAYTLFFGNYYLQPMTVGDIDWVKFARSTYDTMTLRVNNINLMAITIVLYSYSGTLVQRKSWTKYPGQTLTYTWDSSTGWGSQFYVKIYYHSGGETGDYGNYKIKVTYTSS